MFNATIAEEVNGASCRTPTSLEERIRGLSDRLVAAQRPLRILDAVKSGDEVERAFFAADRREPPPVTRSTYACRPLPFDPNSKRQELLDLERDVRARLGVDHAAGRMMTRMCEEYRSVVDLIDQRGTRAFGDLSKRLYGSSGDRFHAGAPTLADLGRAMAAMLDNLAGEALVRANGPRWTPGRRCSSFRNGWDAISRTHRRCACGCPTASWRTRRPAAITSRSGRTPALRREVRLLEVHEGWVHLGTTLNGQRQPVCTFLGRTRRRT